MPVQHETAGRSPDELKLSGIGLGSEVPPRQRTVVPSGRSNSDSSARVGSPSQSPFLAMAKAAVVVARSRESAIPAPSRYADRWPATNASPAPTRSATATFLAGAETEDPAR